MRPTYIAGYDGTEASRHAVSLAVRLAAVREAVVIAAHAYPVVEPIYGKGASQIPAEEINAESRQAAERRLAELTAPVEARLLPSHSPAHALTDLAEREDADLIAVGLTHHAAIGRLLVGSVGERMLHGAPCPVLVVPPGAEDGPVRAVGVAYDERPESLVALREAADLASGLGARLVVFTVVDPNMWWPQLAVDDKALEAMAAPRFARALEEISAQREAGLSVETRMLTGAPGAALVAAARDGIDLMVTGSRGYGPVRSVLLGSVSRHLVDHAPCPVLVVPRAAHAAAPVEEAAVGAHA